MDWTGEIVGMLHSHKITQRELAEEIGLAEQYVSQILNKKRSTEERQRERIENGIMEIIARREI